MARSDGSAAMFDRIAGRYDLLNLLLTGGLDHLWRRRLVSALIEATGGVGEVLDWATGTADVALSIARRAPRSSSVGLDPSAGMLAAGATKSVAARLERRVHFCVGDGQMMPFSTGRFAASCTSFGIRNVPDRLRGLREMARVTRRGGLVAILEASEPSSGPVAVLARLHLHHVVPRLGWLISGGDGAYDYLRASIAAFPEPPEFCELMRAAGLWGVRAERQHFGAAHLYFGQAPG